MDLTVASHNTMHGVFLEALIDQYQTLVQQHELDVLCLQENVALPNSTAKSFPTGQPVWTQAELVRERLGDFKCVCLAECPGLATLLRNSITVHDAFLIHLPRLARLRWFERLYIRGGKAKQKYALATVVGNAAAPITIVNFHLETAGSNLHRTKQVAAIAHALAGKGIVQRVIACGDTNAFTWSRNAGARVTAEIMRPLHETANAIPRGNISATHYFGRQNEDLVTHRLLTALGKIGIDHPLPYDVICTDLDARYCDKLSTPASDHDLVFAKLG
jgi:endonuclease/exonuclease/phosphatase family metal-dependent hydrolase